MYYLKKERSKLNTITKKKKKTWLKLGLHRKKNTVGNVSTVQVRSFRNAYSITEKE